MVQRGEMGSGGLPESLLQSLSIFPDRATRGLKNPVCPEFSPRFPDAFRRCNR